MSKHSFLLTAGMIAVTCLAAPALGQWAETDKLLANDGAADDQFGRAVSISGDTVVIGALYDEGNGDWSGSAYVFERSGSNWVRMAKLLPSDGVVNDGFGCSVSISGNTVVIGAVGVSHSGSPGSAYVFERPVGGWSGKLNEDAKLLPGDGAAGDHFGVAVSVSGDTLVVGALWDDDNGSQSGSAYLFEESGSDWVQVAKLLASDGAADDYFGCAVSISDDTIVVGASGDDDNGSSSGSAYVFDKPPDGWPGTLNEDAKLLPSDSEAGDWFGVSASVSGDTVVVGALWDDDNGTSSGSAYVFERPAGGWSGTLNQDAKLLASDGEADDNSGISVSVSGDTIVVGALWDDDNGNQSGSAYVFERPVGGWSGTLNQEAKLLAADGAADDSFGGSVSIFGDTVVIGAGGDKYNGTWSGSAYLFQDSGSGWTEIAKLRAGAGAAGDRFGQSVSISGDTVVVGAYFDRNDNGSSSGSAYVFQHSGSGWTEIAKLLAADGTTGDEFGRSVSVSGDTIVVGVHGDDDNDTDCGSAYVFQRSGSSWVQVAKLLASDSTPYARFGYSVAISGDTVVVGALYDNDNGWCSGSAYVFEKPVGGWSGTLREDAKLLASDGAAEDWFGYSVSVAGDAVVVGAYRNDDDGAWSGSAYVFERPERGWSGTLSEDAKLLASDGASRDQFGQSVSISGDIVVVGADSDDDNGGWSGSAYMFERPAGGWSGTRNEDAKLLAGDGAQWDHFGYSVSISGDTVVVGAYRDDDNGNQSGSAYVFNKPAGGWSGILNEDAKLLAGDGAASDEFGTSVSISGDTAVVGAQFDGDNGRDSGSAYVFVRAPLGDLNCDGAVGPLDVDPFVLALVSAGNAAPFDDYYAAWPDCNPLLADINADGTVNLFDVDPFVDLLTGG